MPEWIGDPLTPEGKRVFTEAESRAHEARRVPTFWTPERVEELMEMRRRGVSLRDCAEHFSRSKSRVGQVAAKAARRAAREGKP
jgi:hypothetical protein